ncbi:Hypothetical protein SMAX5B_012464 [Scophthalmus maximus]|uniref:Uncharacterized protein n=1 Tax=Scophthalmus maximus TaxID=52904 RepID=A0A2U9B739_SCOMX|nr:Hypothetical protein SMAX5B_012464 [Scophthalmus maximus]
MADRTDAVIELERTDTETGEDKTKAEESETKKEELRTFVTLVTLEVLKKVGALQGIKDKEWNKYTLLLVDKTLEGLPEGINLFVRPKTVAKAVIVELRGKFGKKLKFMLHLEDPGVDAVIAECFQSQIIALIGVRQRFNFFISLLRNVSICWHLNCHPANF